MLPVGVVGSWFRPEVGSEGWGVMMLALWRCVGCTGVTAATVGVTVTAAAAVEHHADCP